MCLFCEYLCECLHWVGKDILLCMLCICVFVRVYVCVNVNIEQAQIYYCVCYIYIIIVCLCVRVFVCVKICMKLTLSQRIHYYVYYIHTMLEHERATGPTTRQEKISSICTETLLYAQKRFHTNIPSGCKKANAPHNTSREK